MPKHLRTCLTPIVWLFVVAGLAFAQDATKQKLALQDNYPKPIHYRYANNIWMNDGVDAAYQWWIDNFNGAMGVELDSRVTLLAKEGQDKVIQRVMKENPEKYFIFYTTGHIKVPDPKSPYFDPCTGSITDYHPGHFAYQPRSKVLQNHIPLESGETTIKVDLKEPAIKLQEGTTDEDVASFVSKVAFLLKPRPDDICLYTLKADGTPDWDSSEQVILTGIDEKAGTITVQRGAYGWSPKEFKGEIFAAPHCMVAKFGGWYYNFSTSCPRDAKGRQAGDIWSDKYAALFLPGGSSVGFNAIQQDTQVEEVWPLRGVDLNNNGKDDTFDDMGGVNWFAVGLVQALKKLREKLPADVNIMPDAGNRGFYYLNGWEVEGFPGRHDPAWRLYSEVCNRLNFSRLTCVEPRFTHVQHKIFNFTIGDDEKGLILKGKKMPANLTRAVCALSTVYEAGVTWYSQPERVNDRETEWDELVMGKERKLGWLGNVVGEPIYPAQKARQRVPNVLTDAGAAKGEEGTVLRRENGALIASNPNIAKSSKVVLELKSPSPDLTVFAKLRGPQRKGVDVKMPRYVHAKLSGGQIYNGYLIPASPAKLQRGMIMKDGSVKMLQGPVSAKVEWVHNIHTLRLWHKDAKMAQLFWQARLKTPANAHLHYWVHSTNAPASVEAAVVGANGQSGAFKEISRVKQVQGPSPLTRNVDLAAHGLAGKDVVFRFLNEPRKGPNPVANGAWAEVAIASGDAGGNVPSGPMRASLEGFFGEETKPQIFHFNNAPIDTPLKLELEFEGGEDAVVEGLEIYGAPATIVRVFENGIVLANPSPRPATFNLAELSPGKSYRRFFGTEQQDPVTNNGQPVGGTVQLKPFDGLFLVRK